MDNIVMMKYTNDFTESASAVAMNSTKTAGASAGASELCCFLEVSFFNGFQLTLPQ